MWHQSFLDGFQFRYKGSDETIVDGPIFGSKHVLDTDPQSIVDLAPREFVVLLHGRSGSWMDGLGFTTNFGRKFYFGGSGGNGFEAEIPPNCEIRLITAHCGDHVDNVQVLYGIAHQARTGTYGLMASFRFFLIPLGKTYLALEKLGTTVKDKTIMSKVVSGCKSRWARRTSIITPSSIEIHREHYR